MASPDTIILLIVDYHAATGGPRPLCPYAPESVVVLMYNCLLSQNRRFSRALPEVNQQTHVGLHIFWMHCDSSRWKWCHTLRTCWPWETAATLPSARPREALRRPRGRSGAGAYRGGRPPTAYCMLLPFLRWNKDFHIGLLPLTVRKALAESRPNLFDASQWYVPLSDSCAACVCHKLTIIPDHCSDGKNLPRPDRRIWIKSNQIIFIRFWYSHEAGLVTRKVHRHTNYQT